MDAPDVDPKELSRSLRFIRRVNAYLGYTRATLGHLDHFATRWKRGEQITLVDLATGSADIPRAILRWADHRGHNVRIVAVDNHPATLAEARSAGRDDRLAIVQADVLDLPFEAGSFDYALSHMFVHHLDDADVVRVFQSMNRLSRRGVVVADLLRSRRALLWATLFTSFSNPIVRHDARASVRQAFSLNEVNDLAGQSGLSYAKLREHFGHRFVLSGEKF